MESENGRQAALVARLRRPEWGEELAAPSHDPQPPPRAEALLDLTVGQRAEILGRHLRRSRALAERPAANHKPILESKPLLLRTVHELVAQPLADDPRRTAALPIGLLNAQYQIELAAVRNGCRDQIDTGLLFQYLDAALHTLFELLSCYWLRQLLVPERLWNEAHALYRLACLAGIDDPDEMRAPSILAQALRTAYLKPLLMGSLNPARYRPAEIRRIATFLGRYTERARLGKASGLLCIDTASSRPAVYAGRQDSPDCLRLCVLDLVEAIDDDAATDLLLVPRLARDLRRYWTRRQVRTELHRRTDERINVVIGLEVVHQVLSGCDDDDAFPDHLLTVRGPMRASPQRPVHKALCLDRSATGARIRIGTGAPEALSPGTLIAVFAEAGQEVQLGVVRWTLLSADFSAQAGIQWLLPGLEPCAVRSLEFAAQAPFCRAFFYRDAPDSGELLAPAGMFKTGHRLLIRTAQNEAPALLTAANDSTFYLGRFGVRIEIDDGDDQERIADKPGHNRKSTAAPTRKHARRGGSPSPRSPTPASLQAASSPAGSPQPIVKQKK